MVETYTFTIKYFQTEKNGQLLAGLQLDGPGGSSASVGATNEALKELLRQLIAHCSDLPHLPRKSRHPSNSDCHSECHSID